MLTIYCFWRLFPPYEMYFVLLVKTQFALILWSIPWLFNEELPIPLCSHSTFLYSYYSKSDIYLCYIDVTWCYSLFSYYFPTRQILEGIHQCCIFLVSSSPLQCLGKSTWLHVWMIVSLLKASYRRQNLKRALEMDNTLVRWEWHSD